MKIKLTQRLTILDRAYDKAAKFLPEQLGPLAEMERSVLQDALAWSRKIAHERRKDYRDIVWEHFGWNDPATAERFSKILEEIRNGQ